MMIRLATPGDAPAIRALAEAAFAEYVPLIGRRPAPMDEDFAARIGEGVVHVAEIEGDVSGYLIARPEADHMLLDAVAVAPGAKGRGLGRRLVDTCEALARAAGLPEVRLYTNVRMAANLGLYPHLGYRETGRRNSDGFERVFYAKAL